MSLLPLRSSTGCPVAGLVRQNSQIGEFKSGLTLRPLVAWRLDR